MKYGEKQTVDTTDGQKLEGFKFKISNPAKEAILRLPTNDELMNRLGQITFLRTSTGRGTKTTYVENTKADFALFKVLRQDHGPEFDEYEASACIAKLIAADTVDTIPNGAGFTVVIKTKFGEQTHHVLIPMEKDKAIYNRLSQSTVNLPRGRSEIRNHMAPAVELYDKIATSVEGYADGWTPLDVPPHHKSRVIVEVLGAIEDQGADDPNF